MKRIALFIVGILFIRANLVAQTTQPTDGTLSVLEQAMPRYNQLIKENAPATTDDVLRTLKAARAGKRGSANQSSANTAKFLSSRSLQKDHVSTAMPRDVGTYDDTGNDMSGNAVSMPLTFMGHATLNGDTEAISLNLDAKPPRYEFLVGSRNQQTGALDLKRADRKICLTCHQGEGPIFSHFPWSESEFSAAMVDKHNSELTEYLADETIKTLKKLQIPVKDETALRDDLTADDDRQNRINHITDVVSKSLNNPALAKKFSDAFEAEHREPASVSANSPSLFSLDGAVRSANQVLRATDVCQRLCGDDETCHRELLAIAVTGVLPEKEAGAFAKRIQARWPADSFGRASSVLPDVDPLDRPERGGTAFGFKLLDPAQFQSQINTPSISTVNIGSFTFLKNKESNDNRRDAANMKQNINPVYYDAHGAADFRNNTDILQIQRSPANSKFADPKTLRPKVDMLTPLSVSSLGDKYLACFGMVPSDLAKLRTTTPSILREEILSNERFKGLRADKPWDKTRTITQIQKALTEMKEDADSEATTQSTTAPTTKPGFGHGVADGPNATATTTVKRTLAADEVEAMNIMKRSCLECHAATDMRPLPMGSVEALRAYRSKRGKSAGSELNSGSMPPPNSDDLNLTDRERAIMLRVFPNTK